MSGAHIIRKEPCPKCRTKGLDNSGDNLVVYSDGGKFCFACNYTASLSDTYKEKYNIKERKEIIYPMTEFTREQWNKYTSQLNTDPKNFRHLKKATCDKYRVYHEYDEKTGQVVKQIYPVSKDYEFSGYKFRLAPEKKFGAEGSNKKDCDLFGQALFRDSTSKKIVIAQGELDALSAYQMLNENNKSDFDPIPVVSGTVGEVGSIKQYQNNYEFLNKFEQIIFIPDNDSTGQDALHQVAKVLPKSKLHVLELPLKDCNEMLESGEANRFRNMFWTKTKHYSPAGILGSDVLYEMMLEKAKIPKVKFPDFLQGLNKATAGGITQGSIVNITAGSGCVDKDTEYLTPNGWKKISDYSKGDMVLQYNEDGTATFVTPSAYIVEPVEEGEEVYRFHNSTTNTDMVFTEDHSFVYFNKRNLQKPQRKTAKEVKQIFEQCKTGFNGKILNTFDGITNTNETNSQVLDLTNAELLLQLMVMGNGKVTTNGANNHTTLIFTDNKKYEKALSHLQNNNIPHKDKGSKEDDKYSSGHLYQITINPKLTDKTFDSKYYSCTKEQLQIITDNIFYWDGSTVNNCYTTSSKESADFIQYAFTALNNKSSLSIINKNGKTSYKVKVSKVKRMYSTFEKGDNDTSSITNFTMPDGLKYCFRVPSKMLVLRRNNYIFVTGNSGKTTLINQIILDFALNNKVKVGVVSLEADGGDYCENLVGCHMQRKLQLFETPEEKVAFLESDEARNAGKKVLLTDDGTPRFYVIDDRGDYSQLQNRIEELIISCDCNFIVIDVLSDVFDGESLEFQSKWMAWEKSTTKMYGVTIVNIMHTRKQGTGQKSASQGGVLAEEDIAGSSSSYKSASLNIILSRDKTCEDEEIRNMVQVHLAKNRQTGWTGVACSLKYDMKTHRLQDATERMEQIKAEILAQGIDGKKDKPINRFTK